MPIQFMAHFDPSRCFRPPCSNDHGSQRLDTHVGAVAVSKDLVGQFTVTTAEGDKVTLSANLAEDFRTVTYRGAARQDGTSVEVSGRQTEYSVRREVGVTVEGDLSEQEAHELSKLFKKVLNIFRKFFNGQDESALAKTAKLADRFGNFSTLASLDLSVEVERSVTVLAAQAAAELSGQATLPAEAAEPAAVQAATLDPVPSVDAPVAPPSTGTTAPAQPSADSVAAGDTADLRVTVPVSQAGQPRSLVDQVLDALKDSNVAPRKLTRYLPRLLDQVREELQKELRGWADGERRAPSDGIVQTGSAIFLAYQSFRQTALTLSVRT